MFLRNKFLPTIFFYLRRRDKQKSIRLLLKSTINRFIFFYPQHRIIRRRFAYQFRFQIVRISLPLNLIRSVEHRIPSYTFMFSNIIIHKPIFSVTPGTKGQRPVRICTDSSMYPVRRNYYYISRSGINGRNSVRDCLRHIPAYK